MQTQTNPRKEDKVKILGRLFLPAFFMALAGCAGMNSNFDCNKVGGIKGCATIDQVNRMTDQGYFTKEERAEDLANIPGAGTSQNAAVKVKIGGDSDAANFPKAGAISDGAIEPLRLNPSIQNIWIAPYVSADGTYNWPSTITIVVNKGAWIGAPAKAIQDSDE